MQQSFLKHNIALIIMSAGESARFRQKCAVKKHWIRICENAKNSENPTDSTNHTPKPMWLFVADSLQERYAFPQVIITANSEDSAYMRRFCDYEIVEGGETRQESLQNALKNVKSEFVAVSDAARFRLDFGVLDRLFTRDLGEIDCLCPALGVSDTIFMESAGSKTYLNRDSVFLAQTPQISRVRMLESALKKGVFTDESSAINALGGRVVRVDGSKMMDKLTHFTDLGGDLSVDLRAFVGSGFDVHRFCENKPMRLGGVEIPCDYGLEAHSDGDVVIHAICDAILGGIGAGDIGEWFPPDDKNYKGADSRILLQKVVDFARGVGFEMVNVDVMIMAQKPKILPYKAQMTAVLSGILGVSRARVNIKATTMENLGFIGRGEGICANASASLRLGAVWIKQ